MNYNNITNINTNNNNNSNKKFIINKQEKK